MKLELSSVEILILILVVRIFGNLVIPLNYTPAPVSLVSTNANDASGGRLTLPVGTDVKMRVESVSDSNTIANGRIEYVLLDG